MKRGTIDHPKMLMLADELGVELLMAVGIMESLWHWTARYTPRGDIGRYSNAAIARGICWSGDPDKLVDALVSSRWLERDDAHRLIVHDWHEHVDDTVRRALARAAETFANGERPSLARLDRAEREKIEAKYREKDEKSRANRRAPNVRNPGTRRAPGGRPEGALPEPEPEPCQSLARAMPEPEPDTSPADAGAARAPQAPMGGYPADFETFWDPTVRKTGKAAAYKAWGQAVKSIKPRFVLRPGGRSREVEARTWLLERWKAYNASPKAKGEFSPHPATWLNEGRYDDDPVEWQREGGGKVAAGAAAVVNLDIDLEEDP